MRLTVVARSAHSARRRTTLTSHDHSLSEAACAEVCLQAVTGVRAGQETQARDILSEVPDFRHLITSGSVDLTGTLAECPQASALRELRYIDGSTAPPSCSSKHTSKGCGDDWLHVVPSAGA